MTRMLPCLFLLALALPVAAATSNGAFAARLVFKDGRQCQCHVLGCDSGMVTIVRSFDGTTVRERHRIDSLDALHVPCPPCVTQEPPAHAALSAALAACAAECARWKPYRSVKGSWHDPCVLAYARLLDRAGSGDEALALFRQCAAMPGVAAHADEIVVRIALLSSRKDGASNTLAALHAALPRARTDADRAELWHAIGSALARRGDHVDGLFALLTVSVFYSHVAGGEQRSLCATLPSFAALGRRDDFIATCATLGSKFPGTAQAACASNAQARLHAGMPLSSMTSLTFTIKEP